MFPHHDGRYFEQTAVRKDGRFVFGAALQKQEGRRGGSAAAFSCFEMESQATVLLTIRDRFPCLPRRVQRSNAPSERFWFFSKQSARDPCRSFQMRRAPRFDRRRKP